MFGRKKTTADAPVDETVAPEEGAVEVKKSTDVTVTKVPKPKQRRPSEIDWSLVVILGVTLLAAIPVTAIVVAPAYFGSPVVTVCLVLLLITIAAVWGACLPTDYEQRQWLSVVQASTATTPAAEPAEVAVAEEVTFEATDAEPAVPNADMSVATDNIAKAVEPAVKRMAAAAKAEGKETEATEEAAAEGGDEMLLLPPFEPEEEEDGFVDAIFSEDDLKKK